MKRPNAGYWSSLLSAPDPSRRGLASAVGSGGAGEQIRHRVMERVDALCDQLISLSEYLADHPEPAYQEHLSSAAIGRLLEQQGQPVVAGVAGLETALVARAGVGRPCVAILAEYDALPEIGHGCGHNLIAAMAVGAFLAVKAVLSAATGSVVLLGTPAEEGGAGKIRLLDAGAFEGVDVALMAHPFGFDSAALPWLARRKVDVVYRGLAAHAAAAPHAGCNALDAVVQGYVGVAALRQHLVPSDRIHGIITDGGRGVSVVPDRAAATYSLRSASTAGLEELAERVGGIFQGAALATGTELDLSWDPVPAYLPVLANPVLAERYRINAGHVSRSVIGPSDLPPGATGSTDFGNVSWQVPGLHPTVGVAPADVMLHTRDFAAASRGDLAHRGIRDGAVALSLTALDVLTDPHLATLVKEAHAEAVRAAGRP